MAENCRLTLNSPLQSAPSHSPTSCFNYRLWGGRWESNPQRPEPQSGALPVELLPPHLVIITSALPVLLEREALRMQILECRFQNEECRIQKVDFRLQISECRFQNADFRMQISECRFQILLREREANLTIPHSTFLHSAIFILNAASYYPLP